MCAKLGDSPGSGSIATMDARFQNFVAKVEVLHFFCIERQSCVLEESVLDTGFGIGVELSVFLVRVRFHPPFFRVQFREERIEFGVGRDVGHFRVDNFVNKVIGLFQGLLVDLGSTNDKNVVNVGKLFESLLGLLERRGE